MKISLSKNGIILVLLVIVIFLLAVNIVLEKFFHPSVSSGFKELSSSVINKRFLSSLFNYNLDSTWIKRKNFPGVHDDSLKYNYIVAVPADLPVSLLIREIQNRFDSSEVNILSTEFKSNKTTELKISSGGNLKLDALFSYNSLISRKTDTIGFVVTGIEDLNSESFNNLLMIPEHFAGLLIPSKKSQELLKILSENQKETAVVLNDDISELEFKLNTGYSERRIKNSVLSIIGKFYKAAFFIIDENSEIYNSKYFKMISSEFLKRKLILVREDRFLKSGDTSPEALLSAIRAGTSKKKVLEITADDFLQMPPILAGLRKTGYKFINPSELIK
jgi:hypothetical protein